MFEIECDIEVVQLSESTQSIVVLVLLIYSYVVIIYISQVFAAYYRKCHVQLF